MITDTAVVTVTWMDGLSEEYEGRTHVNEGVLHVYDEAGGAIHIPLANIRHWVKS